MTANEVINLIKEEVPGIVKTCLDTYFTELKNREESEWSKTEGSFRKAMVAGITDGSAPQMFMTREQGVSIISRMDKESGLGVINKKED